MLDLLPAMTAASASEVKDKPSFTPARRTFYPTWSFNQDLLLLTLDSEHQNFSQSTEEIKPLTEEEKKQKLADMRAALAEKKAKQSILDKEEAKKNEVYMFIGILNPDRS